MRTRTKGIQITETGERVVNKEYKKQRIFQRLGVISQDDAETWLRGKQEEIDVELRKGTVRTFSEAALKYLVDCERRNVKTIDLIAYHIGLVNPYIGFMAIESVHSGTLESFCDDRLEGDFEKEWRPVTPTTINRSLEVVRTILNKSARVWRDDQGKPWLATAPLIEMLEETNARPAYPITWEEQNKLFKELPAHLVDMALFAVNTGSRDDNICGLEWEWERKIPQLGRSVFIIPAARFKGKRPHVVILNDVAWRVVESCRGRHDQYVFTYQDPVRRIDPDRVDTINNSAWQKARKRAALEHVRVHDLRHTYGQRLRDAGVSNEDRAVLLGHKAQGMAEHYATPTIAKLIEMANKVQETRDTPTLLRVVNG